MATSSSDTVRETPHGHDYVDFDEYIDIQLKKTGSTIKSTDILTAVVGISTLVTAYLLVFVVCDHWLVPGGFGPVTRGIMLAVVVAASVGWLVVKVVWPWRRRVSGLYAASTIEKAAPGLKSNLLNLVDLSRKGVQVPPEVYESIERRAALALTHVDVNEAVDRRSLLRLSNVLLAVVVLFSLYWIFSPKNPATSLLRAVVPSAEVGVATRTEIYNVKPGDKDVLARSQLEVTADLRGEIPPQTTLYFTTADHKFVDERVEMRLENESSKRFRCVLTGDNGAGLLQNMTYRIVAGDAVTPDYTIRVLQPPSAAIESIRLDFPEYTRREPQLQTNGAIDGLEGTKVTLKAMANMPVRSPASLQFFDDETASKRAEEIPIRVTNGNKLQVEWKLEIRSDGTYPHYYRIFCTSEAGESDPSPSLYTLSIRADQPPEIVLRDPTKELEVPANAILPLLIEARDPDFTLRYIDLNIEKDGSPINGPTIYEGNDQQVRTTYKWSLRDYHLRPRDTLVYWLQAKDNRQPIANTATTPKLRIRITDPVPEDQVKKDLAMAEKRQQEEMAKDNAQAERPPQEQGDDENQPADSKKTRPKRTPPSQRQKGKPQSGAHERARQNEKPDENGQADRNEQPDKGQPENGEPDKNQQGEKEKQGPQAEDKKQQLNPDDPADDPKALQKILDKEEREKEEQNGGAQQPPSTPPGASPPSKAAPNKPAPNKPAANKPDKGQGGNSSGASRGPSQGAPSKGQAGQGAGEKNGQAGEKNTDQNHAGQKHAGQGADEKNTPGSQESGQQEKPGQTAGSKPGEQKSAGDQTGAEKNGLEKNGTEKNGTKKNGDEQTQSQPQNDLNQQGSRSGQSQPQPSSQQNGSKGQDQQQRPDSNAGKNSGGKQQPQGSQPQGSESKGTQAKGTKPDASESKGAEQKAAESKGSESNGSESKGKEAKGSEGSQTGERQGNEKQGPEKQGAKEGEKDGANSSDGSRSAQDREGKTANKPDDKTSSQKQSEGVQNGADSAGEQNGKSNSQKPDGKEGQSQGDGSQGQKPDNAGRQPEKSDGKGESADGTNGKPNNDGKNAQDAKNANGEDKGQGQPQNGNQNGKESGGEKHGDQNGQQNAGGQSNGQPRTPNGQSKPEKGQQSSPGQSQKSSERATDANRQTDANRPGDNQPQNGDQSQNAPGRKPRTETTARGKNGATENPEKTDEQVKTNEAPPEGARGQKVRPDDRRRKLLETEGPRNPNAAGERTTDNPDRKNSPRGGQGQSSIGQSADSKQGATDNQAGSQDTEKRTARDGSPQAGDRQHEGGQAGSEGQEKPGGSKTGGSKSGGDKPGNEDAGGKESASGKESSEKAGGKESAGGKSGGKEGSKSGKGDSAGGSQGSGKGEGEGKAGPPNPNGPPGKNGSDRASQPGKSGGKQGPANGNGRGNAGGGFNNGGPSGPGEPLVDTTNQANLDYAKKATNLVLRRLDDQLKRGEIDPKLQDELGWNKDQMRRFVERMRKQAQAADDQNSPAADARRLQFEETLKSLNLRSPAKSRTSQGVPKTNDAEMESKHSIPPPEYRELYNAFTKSLTKSAPAGPRNDTPGSDANGDNKK